MEKNTLLLRDTEAFMRGELDNVTVAGGAIVLDLVQGSYVLYGCYTSAPLPLPVFDALRVSWNAVSPPGTAVEAQARVLVDGNWTPWVSFGKWSPFLHREGPAPQQRGPLCLTADCLRLDSKTAVQAQLRIYLYTKDEKATPAVWLLGASVRTVGEIPAHGRPVNRGLHLMPYVMARRAPALRPWMDRRRRRCAQPELCRRRGRVLGVPGVGVLVRPGDAARRGAPRLRRAGGAAKHPRPAAKRLAAAPVRDGAGVPPYRRHAQGAAVRPLGRRQRF